MNATSKFLKEMGIVGEKCLLIQPTGYTAMWCAYCRSKRHFTRGCPNLTRRRPRKCWNCGEPKHQMRNCPFNEWRCNHSGPHLIVEQEVVKNLEWEFQRLKPDEARLMYETYGENAVLDLIEMEEATQAISKQPPLETEDIGDGLLETDDDNLVLMWLDLYDEVEWMEENRKRSGITFWDNLIRRFRARYDKFEGAAKLDESEWDTIVMRMRVSISNNHCYLRHDTVIQ